MDTQLKHRLTGAVILVALIVLLVPEMLSGPRETASGVDAPSLQQPTSGTAPVAPMRSIDIDLAKSTPAGTAATPASALPAGATPAAAPAVVAAPAGGAAPVTAPASAAPPAAVPRRAPPQEPAARTPWPRSARFVVQVGSFAARDSAESLAARLRRAGFEAQVSALHSGGRTLHRVRVGAATDRVAAEALLLRLRAAGHNGGIVAVQ